MSRFTNPTPQLLDGAGNPAAYGLLYFYESNSNVEKNTYADSDETILNANPVELSSSGRIPNTFYSGSARVVFKTADNSQIWDKDPVGGENQQNDFSQWFDFIIYEQYDIARVGDNYYQSKSSGNQGNDPTDASSVYWEKIILLSVYNSTTSYSTGDICVTSDGSIWKSVSSANLDNDPTTDDGLKWRPATSDRSGWAQVTESSIAFANKQYYIYATSSSVDITQPTFLPNDYIVISNSPESTETVRLLNPSNTIHGKLGTASAGDNIILKAGETISIVARTASILGVIN